MLSEKVLHIKRVMLSKQKEGVEIDNTRDSSSGYSFNLACRQLADKCESLKKIYSLSDFELLTLIRQGQVYVPISIFSKELSALETICKYLRENKAMEFKEICVLLNRDVRTVWQAYDFARRKLPPKFENVNARYFFPAKILANRKLSVLENIVLFLQQQYDMKLSKIALLLKRDRKTIWTIKSRAEKKLRENEIEG